MGVMDEDDSWKWKQALGPTPHPTPPHPTPYTTPQPQKQPLRLSSRKRGPFNGHMLELCYLLEWALKYTKYGYLNKGVVGLIT
jgi:hypothetical protein